MEVVWAKATNFSSSGPQVRITGEKKKPKVNTANTLKQSEDGTQLKSLWHKDLLQS